MPANGKWDLIRRLKVKAPKYGRCYEAIQDVRVTELGYN